MSVTESELTAALIAHEALAEQGPKGDKGDPGRDGKDGRDGVDGKDGTSGPKGDRGPVGADGAVGPRGIPGTDGKDGADGKDGRDGVDGADGKRGPQGLQGVAGEKGERGETGPEGPAGSGGGGGGRRFRGVQIVSDSLPPPVLATSFEIGTGLSVEMTAPGAARLSVTGGGSDANYVHDQVVASDVWDITHGLGKYPAVTVIDSAGDVCLGDIHYVSTNRVTVAFGAAFSGTATLN